MGVKITHKEREFINANSDLLEIALDNMANDAKLLAMVYVPRKEGDLQNSILVRGGRLKRTIVVDKEYAAYQERGRRRDGSHVVKNYTTPGTKAHYLEGAGDQVAKNAVNYIKQAAQLIKYK